MKIYQSLRHAFLLIFLPLIAGAQFTQPIGGQAEKDWWIVNYVDHAEDTTASDFNCGTKTYDGHQGTDFVLRSFPQMDSGVAVLAAMDGEVYALVDSLYDREQGGDPSKTYGNFITLRHGDTLFTTYAHLKKGSVIPALGATVLSGTKLAEVGSSGNSISPHLHFEFWTYDLSAPDPGPTYRILDPFKGPCSNDGNWWNTAPKYDTAFHVLDYGMYQGPTAGARPNLFDLQERRFTSQGQPIDIANPGSIGYRDTLWFWAQYAGLQLNDSVSYRWKDADGKIYAEYNASAARDVWYTYDWVYIQNPFNVLPEKTETWKFDLIVNGKVVLTQQFRFSPTSGIQPAAPSILIVQIRGEFLSVSQPLIGASLIGLDGREWPVAGKGANYQLPHHLPRGIYVLKGTSAAGTPVAARFIY